MTPCMCACVCMYMYIVRIRICAYIQIYIYKIEIYYSNIHRIYIQIRDRDNQQKKGHPEEMGG